MAPVKSRTQTDLNIATLGSADPSWPRLSRSRERRRPSVRQRRSDMTRFLVFSFLARSPSEAGSVKRTAYSDFGVPEKASKTRRRVTPASLPPSWVNPDWRMV